MEKDNWNLGETLLLFLLLQGAVDEQGNRICPLCREIVLNNNQLLCDKCEYKADNYFDVDFKQKLCDLIQENKNIFKYIDVRSSDLDDYIKKEVGKAIFYALDFETAVNSNCAKIGHERDGFPYFIEWEKPLDFKQLYIVSNFIVLFYSKGGISAEETKYILSYISL